MITERAQTLVETDPLGAELVMTALAAWQQLPNLVADYLGPSEWLAEARAEHADLADVRRRALALANLADRGGDAYVAAQARAVAIQIDVGEDPGRYGYIDLVERLFACTFVPPDPDEVRALGEEVDGLARQLGGSGDDPVHQWEASRLISGEAKWDVALAAYQDGRRYVRERFPVPFKEALEISRTDEPVASVHLLWREPDRMAFEVNVAVPRTPQTVAFEVAHNIYPGDYLHMAILTQHTYAVQGKVAACIKLKNAPENVIGEGIEDVAPFRLYIDAAPDQRLAWKLEWLRRAAALMAAVELRGAGNARSDVGAGLQRVGHMTPERVELELKRIEHPLWGTYVYTYWLGRHLVEEADRRAGKKSVGAEHLGWLYGGLHLPETFLAQQVL